MLMPTLKHLMVKRCQGEGDALEARRHKRSTHPAETIPFRQESKENRSRLSLLSPSKQIYSFQKTDKSRMRIVNSSLGSIGSSSSPFSSKSSSHGKKKEHDMVMTGQSYQAKIPRGLRVLPSSSSVLQSSASSSSELSDLQAQASLMEQWWQEPRWMQTKRIYSRKSCRD
jgi:hypothetical protein